MMIKTVITFIVLSLIVSGATGQEYIDSDQIYFSDKLKADMEFTWEILKFEFNDNGSSGLAEDQVSSTVTVTEVITTFTMTETSEPTDIPDIKPGTKYTVKILKDLGPFTENIYWDDDENAYEEFFDVAFSDLSINTSNGDYSPQGFIAPSRIIFENGTELNYFEYQVEQFNRGFEEGIVVPPEDYEFVFQIEDGVFIEKTSMVSEDGSSLSETRIDVETGIALYIRVLNEFGGFSVDIEIVLYQTEGIDIGTIIGNDDPTLSIPFSTMFVYALILVPVIVSRIRKQDNQ